MQGMYVLHYAPDNASLIVRLVLEAALLPYRPALVDRRVRAQDSADFRALNPAGLIPVLETADGPISETGAILLWLADRHGLCPAPDSPARAHLLRWLFFLSNTAHADLRQLFYPDEYVPEIAGEGHHDLLVGRVRRHFALLEHAAHEAPALWQPDGILLPYAAALARWAVLYPRGQAPWFALSRLPLLAERLAALEATPAAHAVARAEGLGPHPFTHPAYPHPPEGSAT
jgi:glutathione S-transferase